MSNYTHFSRDTSLWGLVNPGSMGVTQSLPPIVTIPSEGDYALRAICSLLHRCMGQCRKIEALHGVSPNSAWQYHQRIEGVWPSSSVSTPMPSLPLLSG